MRQGTEITRTHNPRGINALDGGADHRKKTDSTASNVANNLS